MKTLRDRCREFMAPYRIGMEPADERDFEALETFVKSEMAREQVQAGQSAQIESKAE